MQKKFENISEISTLDRNNEPDKYSIIAENIWKTFKIPLERRYKLHEQIASLILRKNRGYNLLRIFEGISFKVQRGETIGIIGDNGSGKSTLLKILSKIIYPDKGSIEVKGRVASFIELGVGFDFNLTAEENIFLYGAILGVSRTQIKNHLVDIFEFAELTKFRFMKLRNYSSGMILRLAFSTAMQMDPDILLLDEIIAVGDQDFQKKCFAKIVEFTKNKKTIVLVSHALETIKKICVNAMWLKDGKIAAYGKCEDVVKEYLNYVNAKRS